MRPDQALCSGSNRSGKGSRRPCPARGHPSHTHPRPQPPWERAPEEANDLPTVTQTRGWFRQKMVLAGVRGYRPAQELELELGRKAVVDPNFSSGGTRESPAWWEIWPEARLPIYWASWAGICHSFSRLISDKNRILPPISYNLLMFKPPAYSYVPQFRSPRL